MPMPSIIDPEDSPLVPQGFSVVSGGVGCLLATGWLAAKTPELRTYRKGHHESEA